MKIHYRQVSCVKHEKTIEPYSGKYMNPSLLVSKSMKNCEGGQHNCPGIRSPLRKPSPTQFDSDGGNIGTSARIKSTDVIRTSPAGVLWVVK